MSMKKTVLAATAAIALLGAFALPAQAQFVTQVQFYGAPPPPRHEVMPGPRPGHQWVPGHWEPRGSRHAWVAGFWVPDRRGYAYAQPEWRERDGRWHMDQGRWERHERREGRRDYDRDGVPDRFDRQPANPYRN